MGAGRVELEVQIPTQHASSNERLEYSATTHYLIYRHLHQALDWLFSSGARVLLASVIRNMFVALHIAQSAPLQARV